MKYMQADSSNGRPIILDLRNVENVIIFHPQYCVGVKSRLFAFVIYVMLKYTHCIVHIYETTEFHCRK